MSSENDCWSKETVVVVTGANRGIGLEICRQVADKGLRVVLTARNPKKGLSDPARAFLEEGRENVYFHTLDISLPESVSDFVDWLKQTFGFLDILGTLLTHPFITGEVHIIGLINNAGVAQAEIDWDLIHRKNVDMRTIVVDRAWTEGIRETYEMTRNVVGTNYYGTKRITEALVPLLRPSPSMPRIVNVTSTLGLLSCVGKEEVKERMSKLENLSKELIDEMVESFLEEAKCGKDLNGWSPKFPSYVVSKAATNAYTRVLARDLEGKACVNSVHPGYVKTDMTLGSGDISAADGAAHVLRVALFPPGGPSGCNFLESQESSF